MTTAQKTLITYATGSKAMAFLAYKADSTATQPEISFEAFCSVMDRQMENHLNSLAVSPVSGKKESPIWAK